MFENYSNAGSDAENHDSNSGGAVFSVADMSEFRPPVRNDLQLAQANQNMHQSDLFAGYKQETRDALRAFDFNDVAGFAKQYIAANGDIKRELRTALGSAGISLTQNPEGIELSMKDTNYRNVNKVLNINNDGTMTPRLTSTDKVLDSKFKARQQELNTPETLAEWTSSFVKAIFERPRMRSA